MSIPAGYVGQERRGRLGRDEAAAREKRTNRFFSSHPSPFSFNHNVPLLANSNALAWDFKIVDGPHQKRRTLSSLQ